MNSLKINKLEWDSNYFKKNIGSVYIKEPNVNLYNTEDFDLIYVFSDNYFQFKLNSFEKSFSETKLLFSKEIRNINKINNIEGEIITNPVMTPNDEIYKLAIKSGDFSRFNLDEKVLKTDFENLYKKWIEKSFDYQEKDQIIIYKIENKIAGLLAFKIDDTCGFLTLISVQEEFKGKGIGVLLVKKLENILLENNIIEVKISTQEINLIACNFYKKLGYKIINTKYLNHYWKI